MSDVVWVGFPDEGSWCAVVLVDEAVDGGPTPLQKNMTPEQALRDKLRKIEALFAGATTDGEKAAAGVAAERIRERDGPPTWGAVLPV